MNKIDEDEVKIFYESLDSVWQKDNWYKHTQEYINQFIRESNINPFDYVLNAGSGGSTYNLKNKMMHLDIAKNKIDTFEDHTVGSIENTEFKNNAFDGIICVGSVLNYVDSVKSISEIARTLKPNGYLILEFESSWGFEHFHTNAFKKEAEIVSLEYFGEKRKQWVYSPKYVEETLKNYNFSINKKRNFHILSSFQYNRTRDENKSASLDKFDLFLNRFYYLKKYSSNVIYLCTKN